MDKTKENRAKGRAEARAKIVMKLAGWDILVDERNYIIRKDQTYYYFSTLAGALADIADDLEKGLIKENLLDTIKILQQNRKDFLNTISKAVHNLERV